MPEMQLSAVSYQLKADATLQKTANRIGLGFAIGLAATPILAIALSVTVHASNPGLEPDDFDVTLQKHVDEPTGYEAIDNQTRSAISYYDVLRAIDAEYATDEAGTFRHEEVDRLKRIFDAAMRKKKHSLCIAHPDYCAAHPDYDK